jgi:hypothetical protein
MSDSHTNPLKRFLLWLSGAPAEPVQAAPGAPPAPPAAANPPVAAESAPVIAEGMPTETPRPAAPEAERAAIAAGAAGAGAAETADSSSGIPTAATAAAPNDATGYGVTIVQSDAPLGALYWRATLVHHLTPDENHGNHHIFLDALDEHGARVSGARGRVNWEGGEQIITVDKPAGEPGTNFPMWKWQVCTVEMLDLPSDRIVGLHTGHPDEPPGAGNSLFHHSFAVHFQRAVKGDVGEPTAQPPGSAIGGTVGDAAGHTLLLTLEGEIVARQALEASGAYRFEGLPAGDYVLVIEDTGVHSGVVALDGKSAAMVDLALPAAAADQAVPAAGAAEAKFIDRYFLFGPPSSARTSVYLDLARSYLLANQPTFGFRVEDAMHAQRVVIMGALEDIPQATEDALRQAGSQVRRISGTPQQIQDALRQLDSGGHQIFLPMAGVDTGRGQ